MRNIPRQGFCGFSSYGVSETWKGTCSSGAVLSLLWKDDTCSKFVGKFHWVDEPMDTMSGVAELRPGSQDADLRGCVMHWRRHGWAHRLSSFHTVLMNVVRREYEHRQQDAVVSNQSGGSGLGLQLVVFCFRGGAEWRVWRGSEERLHARKVRAHLACLVVL